MSSVYEHSNLILSLTHMLLSLTLMMLSLSFMIDACGARRTYTATMLLLACLAGSYGLMTTSSSVALIAFSVEFVSTPIYPCHVKWIQGVGIRVRVMLQMPEP